VSEHICNAYCRPVDGLCCEVAHIWVEGGQDHDEHFADLLEIAAQGRLGNGSTQILRLERAPEVPPLPRDQWEEDWEMLPFEIRDGLRRSVEKGYTDYGYACLYWFCNVPALEPAEAVP
jgi:hypothetical protein